MTYLETAAFRNLAPITRANKRGRLDWIRAGIGPARYAKMEPRHVESLMEKKGGPEAANHLGENLRRSFAFAAKRYGFKGQNPAALADTHRVRSAGYRTWTDDEVETFRTAHPTGSKARLALELFLGTGAARLAEAGASEYEVMSFLGHRSAKVASRYVAAANRAKLADSGMAKLGAETGNLSNPPARLDKKGGINQ